MNLCACLGVGPGHRLLLGSLTPCTGYLVPMVAANAPVSPPPPRPRQPRPIQQRVAYGPRMRRTSAESEALQKQVLEMLASNMAAGIRMNHELVGRELGISREYVAKIANLNGISRRHLSMQQRESLVAKARRLVTERGFTVAQAARECGVSPSYLQILKGRHA